MRVAEFRGVRVQFACGCGETFVRDVILCDEVPDIAVAIPTAWTHAARIGWSTVYPTGRIEHRCPECGKAGAK
jgi:hypothetical protein